MRLQTKLLFILASAFLVALCVQLSVNSRSAQQELRIDLRREARNIRGVLMATRRVYHHQFLDSGIPLTNETVGFLPAHSMNRISADFGNWTKGGLVFNNVSDRPRNLDNAADELEMAAIDFYRENPLIEERFVPFESEDGEPFYHYTQPIWIEPYCLKCHGSKESAPATIQANYDTAYDYKEGDLRGIMSIKLPAGLARQRASAVVWRKLWFDVAIYLGAGLLVYWLLVRHMARRLRKLEHACGRLADGNYGSRSGITGNDEIGDVAGLFDEMAERIEDRDVALQASEERKRRIVETAHDAFVAIDAAGIIIEWNDKAEKTFGWSREEILGRELTETIVPPQYRDIHTYAMEKLATTGRGRIVNRRVELSALRRNGEEFPVELAIAQDHIGETVTYNAFVRDITERKQAEEELRSSLAAVESARFADRAKGEFLANMSHELRTPMTAILGFGENLLDADQPDSQRLECVETIRRNGEYLLELINDILDLSKIEAGEMMTERRTCQPCRVVAEVVALMRVQADAKGLQFDSEYVGAIPETIQSDPRRLRQILINLIGNAIKFTEAGSVRLVTQLLDVGDGPCLQFEVIDTGRGMTQEEASKLFLPFQQVDTSTVGMSAGTGLGLTISRRFAEMLGGDMTVARTELGVGSTFRASVATGSLDGVNMLEYPKSDTVVVENASTVAPARVPDLRGLRILLAEDGSDNQKLISFVLKRAGADVTVEQNGQRAVETTLAARDTGHPFDAILMDMQMPVMDGYEATSLLRKKGYTGPIIAITADAMDGDCEKCLQAGCNDYATKPFDRVKLLGLIKRHLAPAEAT